MDVRIVERDPVEVVYVRRTGAYRDSAPAAFTALWNWINENGLVGRVRGTFGYGHDDPAQVPADQLRYDACVRLEGSIPTGGEVAAQTLPGGRYAVHTLVGPYVGIAPAFRAIYTDWLPGSGESLGLGPWLEVYLNDPTDTPEKDLKTELCVPLIGGAG